jgi:ribulose 1,5-bisphosphate carboxylase large subunit-like protein
LQKTKEAANALNAGDTLAAQLTVVRKELEDLKQSQSQDERSAEAQAEVSASGYMYIAYSSTLLNSTALAIR